MRPLAVVVVGDARDRAAAAYEIAAAAAALGRDTAMFFRASSVVLLAGLADELATARALGVRIAVCAEGLADHGVALPDGVEAGGMVGFLGANAAAELVTV